MVYTGQIDCLKMSDWGFNALYKITAIVEFKDFSDFYKSLKS